MGLWCERVVVGERFEGGVGRGNVDGCQRGPKTFQSWR